jgi:hypothetical protein
MGYAEIARHLPGLASILRTLREDHVLGWFDRVGRCYMPEAGDSL